MPVNTDGGSQVSVLSYHDLTPYSKNTCPAFGPLALQLEVSQLEGSLQQPKAQSSMSPYLVPDTAALCQHLHLIRQLAASGCFIIIIPRTGQCALVLCVQTRSMVPRLCIKRYLKDYIPGFL